MFHQTLNFDTYPQWGHVLQLHEVYKTRRVEFGTLSSDARDIWFTPAIASDPYTIQQRWGNCTTDDARLIRDIYCAFYVALSNILAIAGDKKLRPSSPPASGWMEILVDPLILISEMREVLEWSDEIADTARVYYGLDLFQFIDAQYELKSGSYLQRPTIDLTSGRNGPGYSLTCKRTQAGRYKLRLSPPYIQTDWSIKHVNHEFECTLKPRVWHPNFVLSKTNAAPRFSVNKDSEWLRWDPNQLCFRGIIPRNCQPKKDSSGRWYIRVEITADYSQIFQGRKPDSVDCFYLRESITARSRAVLPTEFLKNRAAIPTVSPIIYPSIPLQFLWNSHKIGFQRQHSEFIVEKAREYERELSQNCGGKDARLFATYGTFPWDPKEPNIQSWGQVTWIDFLKQQRARAEYLRGPRGRFEVIRDLRKGPRYDPHNWKYAKDDSEVDEDLEEMRKMYENLNHEAHAIIWLHTLYRESFQDRLEDESFEMEAEGLRSLDFSPYGVGGHGYF